MSHRLRGNLLPAISKEYFIPNEKGGTIVLRPSGSDGPPGSVGVPKGTREAQRNARAAGETTYIINGVELYLPEHEPQQNGAVGVPVDVEEGLAAGIRGVDGGTDTTGADQESKTSRKLNRSEQRIDGEPGRPIVDPDGNVVTESTGTPEPVAGFTVPPWEQAGFDSEQAWIRAGLPSPFGRDDPGGAMGTGETPIADTGSAVRAASAITTQRARQRKLQAAQPPVARIDTPDLGGDVDLDPIVDPGDARTGPPITDPRDIFNPLPDDGDHPRGPPDTDPRDIFNPDDTGGDGDGTATPPWILAGFDSAGAWLRDRYPGPGGTNLVPLWERAGFDSAPAWIRAGSPAPRPGDVVSGGGVTGTPPVDEALNALLPVSGDITGQTGFGPDPIEGGTVVPPGEGLPPAHTIPFGPGGPNITDPIGGTGGLIGPAWVRAGFDSVGAWLRAGRPGPLAPVDATTGGDTNTQIVTPGDPLPDDGGRLRGPPTTDPRDIFNPQTPRPANPRLPVDPLVPDPSVTPRPVGPGIETPGPGRRPNENLAPDKATNALIPNRTTSLSPSAADVQQNVAASGNENNLTAKGALFPRKRPGGVRLGKLAPQSFR